MNKEKMQNSLKVYFKNSGVGINKNYISFWGENATELFYANLFDLSPYFQILFNINFSLDSVDVVLKRNKFLFWKYFTVKCSKIETKRFGHKDIVSECHKTVELFFINFAKNFIDNPE